MRPAKAEDFFQYNHVLKEFIDDELKTVQEPQRKGIPKGERIDFLRKVTAAILRGLTRLSFKDISYPIKTTSSIVGLWVT